MQQKVLSITQINEYIRNKLDVDPLLGNVAVCGEISNYKELAAAFFTAVTQGVLVAGASVYAKQLYIQAKKQEEA